MKKYHRFINIIAYVGLSIIFLLLLVFCLFHFGFLTNFLDIKFDKKKLNFTNAQISMYDNKSNLILSDNNQVKNLEYAEIPKTLINAFISIEDKNFYNHKGINYKRMIGATIKNIKSHKIKEGASTISQQVIKNTHLTNEKTIKRKIKELILAQQMEKELTKDEIITSYLNAIYFGNGAFGVNQASQRYFSKEPKDLNLSEMATLAGIIKSPLTYSPLSSLDKCTNRRNLVLKEMLKEKMISEEDYNTAKNSEILLNVNKNFLGNNTYYSAVVDEACKILKLNEKDLLLKNYKIYTYKDNEIQKEIENQISKSTSYTNNFECDSMAMVIDNNNGGVLGFCGKSDYNLLNLNRQPGSILKPVITYAPALEYNVITPLTPILDEKISYNGYEPKNYDKKNYGWISAKDSLAKSLNIPSVKILQYTGIEKAKNFANRLNINFDEKDTGYSLALGGLTNGLKIKDIINSYQAFANSGNYIKSSFIKEIKTNNNKTIYKHNEMGKNTMKESTAYLITDMMQHCVKNGTCRKLNTRKYEIAGKTGTVGAINSKNGENTDAWNISYTPNITLGVWFGSTKQNLNLPKYITGANAPSLLAQNFYNNINLHKDSFKKPESVTELEINEVEYKNNKIMLATDNTPDRYKIKALFSKDNIPKQSSNMFNEIDNTYIEVKKIDDIKIEIKFEALKHLKYLVVREIEDTKKVLATLQDKQEIITIEDNDLNKGNIYTYYLIATYKDILNGCEKTGSISNKVKILIS